MRCCYLSIILVADSPLASKVLYYKPFRSTNSQEIGTTLLLVDSSDSYHYCSLQHICCRLALGDGQEFYGPACLQ